MLVPAACSSPEKQEYERGEYGMLPVVERCATWGYVDRGAV